MFSTAYSSPYLYPYATQDNFNFAMTNPLLQQPLTPTRVASRASTPPRLHPSASMPNMWSTRFAPLHTSQPQAPYILQHDASNASYIDSAHVSAAGRLSRANEELGRPLTPPLTPITRLSLSMQNAHLHAPAPNRLLQPTQQPRFSPFSSPATPIQQHGQVQFPRTESLQDEQPTSPVRAEQMIRLGSPAVVEFEPLGHPEGRLLLVGGIPKDASATALTNAFIVLGDLKGIFVRFQAEHGAIVLAWYDIRHAVRAHRQMRTLRFFKENVRLSSRFISPGELRKYTGTSSFIDDAEGEVYISTMGDGVLNQLALQNALAGYGGLRQFRVVGAHGKAFFAEYFDTRDATAAVSDLHDRTLMGVHLRLTHRHPPQPLLPNPTQALSSMLTINDLQRRHDELALFSHFHQLVALKQQEERAGSCTAPDGSDGARGGPYDTREGTLGRRGSFPGSSPRVDEKEERYAAIVPDNMPLDDHERERKGSNVYGPDHSKAVLPSYPSPRTPQHPHTPKRKVSLPPYSGPLPPPNTQGSSLTWPLPLPLRIPTPPPSSSTASGSASASTGADSPEFFIPTQTPPRRQARGSAPTQAAHAFLPASARAVLDLLREPPPERNRIDIGRIEQGLDTRTTVMLKNVPNKMTDRHLMAFIDTVCARSYTFLYLRMDFENHCNVGYAFVNFIDVASLLRFAKAKLGQKWGMFSSEKVLHMSYANYQGKEALIEKFRNSGVMEEREAWRPKIFFSAGPMVGMPEAFPAANNHLRQQRSFQNGRAQGLFNASAPHPQLSP